MTIHQPGADAAAAARPVNRRTEILDAAAELFARGGYDGSSIRDIATAAAVRPASVYYHYPSKEALLIAVLQEGVRVLTGRVRDAIGAASDPWDRLQAACEAHLEALLRGNDYVRVLSAEIPSRRAEKLQRQLVAERNRYEDIFRELVDELPVAPGVDRKYLRLTLLGAMGWSLIWYRAEGDSPTEIAHRIVALIRRGADPE